MKKLIIVLCAIAAQAQAEEYNWRLQRELRNIEDQQDELIEQNERIAEQNEHIANQLQSDNLSRQLDADRIERKRILEKSLEEQRSRSESREVYIVIEKPAPTPEPKPLPPLLLPSNGLNDYEVLEKLPAGSIIHAPEGDIIVK